MRTAQSQRWHKPDQDVTTANVAIARLWPPLLAGEGVRFRAQTLYSLVRGVWSGRRFVGVRRR